MKMKRKSRRMALTRLSTPFPLPLSHPALRIHPSSRCQVSMPTTAHLRPTSSFALTPPSPPIHEGRRLRKKSRPKSQRVFELADFPLHRRGALFRILIWRSIYRR